MIWDEEKYKRNLDKHKLDFSLAERILTSPKMFDMIDKRNEYGEERHLAYAEVEGIKMCLCYVLRDNGYRVISLRRVREREWRKIKWR